ncbi:MAG: LuxR C-terminal-related transcriptional regulator [Bacteroidota bacterium]
MKFQSLILYPLLPILISMQKTILVYGVAMAVLLVLLKFVEYRFLLRDLTLETAIGFLAVFFTSLGVWAGIRLTRRKMVIGPDPNFRVNDWELQRLGISKREREVLESMARGLSNQEIADSLFISLSTVKTHSSNLFQKLGAERRTQALQKARELGILP